MMIAARNAFLMGGGKPTARDYVQNGLVAMWDGIENAGWGQRNATTTTWRDLTGNGYDLGIRALSSIAFWGDNCFTFNKRSLGGNEYFWYRANTDLQTRLGTVLTLEICVNVRTGSLRDYAGFIGNSGGNTNGIGASLSVARNRLEIFATTGSATSGSSGLIYTPSANVLGRQISLSYTANTAATALKINNVATGTGGAINTLQQTEICVGSSFDANNDGSNPYSSLYYRTPLADFHCVRVYSRAITAAEVAANHAIDAARFGL